MAFPPAHILVGAGFAEVVRSFVPLPRGRAWLAGGFLAVLPDVDLALGLLQRQATLYHGTFTHSLVAVAVVGLVAWWVAGARWALLAATCYGSHLLVDLLDDRGRTNVLLGWPFTHEPSIAIAKLFPLVGFDQGQGVIAATLSLFRPAVVAQLATQTAVGVLFAAALLAVAFLVRRLRPAR